MSDDYMDVDDAGQMAIAAEVSAFRATAASVPLTPTSGFQSSEFAPSSPSSLAHIHSNPCVVDTNFLLSHLRTFSRVVAAGPALSYCVALPFVVLHELDGLSKGTKNNRGEIAKLANDVNKFLHSCLSSHTPGLVGQSLAEHASMTLPANATNDDRILAYCVTLGQAFGRVVLLTGDRNLSLKAMVSGVTVLDNEVWKIGTPEIVMRRLLYPHLEEQPLPGAFNQNRRLSYSPERHHRRTHHMVKDVGWTSPQRSGSLLDEDVDMDVDSHNNHQRDPSPIPLLLPTSPTKTKPGASAATLSSFAALPSLLTPPFIKHIDRILSADPWIISRPKPGEFWSTTELLNLVQRHWIAVFNDVYPRSVKDLVPGLLRIAKELDRITNYGLGTLGLEEEKEWLRGVEALLNLEGADREAVERCRKEVREGLAALR